MDETLEFVLDRVTRHDQARSAAKDMAEHWVSMWKLDPGFTKPIQEAIAKGLEQVILPTPFNVVNLSQRLLSTTPRIDVIPTDIANKDSERNAELSEKWLTAMWKAVNKQARRNLLADNIWTSLVYGKHVFDVRWIYDQLPSALRKTNLPFAIRTLRPTDVGIEQGPYTTEFAYHRYETTLLEVLRRWPELKNAPTGSALRSKIDNYEVNQRKTEDQLVLVTDYWATEPEDGDIWNGVMVEDEWAKRYERTSYPMIPIIVGRGDYAVGVGDEFDGLSILHSIDGLWQYQCRLASQMATGLMWYFWPHFLIENENNTPMDDIELVPGGQDQVPSGTKVQQVSMNPNVPLAQEVYQQLEGYVQQSTYPDVMYGKAPGELTAGYGVSLLSDAAKGRVKNFQEGLEMSLTHVNELVLALVEKKGGKKGVSIYGVDEREGQKYSLTISKETIQGVYCNEVHIAPALPHDDLQMVVQGKQLADSKYISSQTLRDKYLAIQSPTDETRRIALEEAMQSDELRAYRLRKAMEDYYGAEDALTIIFSAGDQAQGLMPPAPEGYEWTMGENGKVTLKRSAPQGSPGGSTPAPDAGSGTPMPGAGPLPPGPPPPATGGAQPPATLVPPMGGGIPPVLQGQVEGENLGLPQAGDPLLFQQAMGNPLQPQEEMNLSAGMPM